MMDRYMDAISESICEVLAKKGWSVTAAAGLCQISRRKFTDLASGKAKGVRLSTLVKVSEGIGVPLGSLIGIDRERSKERESQRELDREVSFHMRKAVSP